MWSFLHAVSFFMHLEQIATNSTRLPFLIKDVFLYRGIYEKNTL